MAVLAHCSLSRIVRTCPSLLGKRRPRRSRARSRIWLRSTRRELAGGHAQQGFSLAITEAFQLRYLAFCVFPIYLDQACDEEILLFGCASLPIVRFDDCDKKPDGTGPLSDLFLLGRSIGIEVVIGLDSREIFQIPRFSNRKGGI